MSYRRLVFLVLSITVIPLAGWWSPAVWLGFAAAEGLFSWLPRSGLAGLRVDDEGIHEVAFWRRVGLHRWADIESFRLSDGQLTLRSASGLIDLPRDALGVERLAQELRQRIEPAAGDAGEVTPEQIAGWLGLTPHEWLRLRPEPTLRRAQAIAVTLALGLVVLMEELVRHWFPAQGWFTWCTITALILVQQAWQAGPLEVSASGLRSRHWSLAWSEVTDCTGGPHHVNLSTSRGPIQLAGPETERVSAAIRKILDARRAGAVLPRMTDVPEHALSRAETVEVSAERGISAAEGDGR